MIATFFQVDHIESLRRGNAERLSVEASSTDHAAKFGVPIIGEAGADSVCQIGLDGRLYYGPLEGLLLSGCTLAQAQDKLETALREWYRDPRVEVTWVECRSARATVLGRVGTPQQVVLRGDERVLDLIAACGGLATSRFSGSTEELADLSGAIYIRNGEQIALDFTALIQEGDLRYNIQVHPGDRIYIPSSMSREVQVLGAVRRPQSVGYRRDLTLLEAISGAGGWDPDADIARCIILRDTRGTPQIATIDMGAVLRGEQAAPRLLPHDVVYLPGPRHPLPKSLFNNALEAFVASAAGVFGDATYDALRD